VQLALLRRLDACPAALYPNAVCILADLEQDAQVDAGKALLCSADAGTRGRVAVVALEMMGPYARLVVAEPQCAGGKRKRGDADDAHHPVATRPCSGAVPATVAPVSANGDAAQLAAASAAGAPACSGASELLPTALAAAVHAAASADADAGWALYPHVYRCLYLMNAADFVAEDALAVLGVETAIPAARVLCSAALDDLARGAGVLVRYRLEGGGGGGRGCRRWTSRLGMEGLGRQGCVRRCTALLWLWYATATAHHCSPSHPLHARHMQTPEPQVPRARQPAPQETGVSF